MVRGSCARRSFLDRGRNVRMRFRVDLLGPAEFVDDDCTMGCTERLNLRWSPGSNARCSRSRRDNSIAVGTSEIERDIFGERVLGLHGEPRHNLVGSELPRN